MLFSLIICLFSFLSIIYSWLLLFFWLYKDDHIHSKLIILQWDLCGAACDAVFNFLKYYTVTASSVTNSHLQVVVLTQLLNDSPAFQSVSVVNEMIFDNFHKLVLILQFSYNLVTFLDS